MLSRFTWKRESGHCVGGHCVDHPEGEQMTIASVVDGKRNCNTYIHTLHVRLRYIEDNVGKQCPSNSFGSQSFVASFGC